MEKNKEKNLLQVAANVYEVLKYHSKLEDNEISAVIQILVYHDSMFNPVTTIK